jgi:hypothetical protein
MLGADGNRHNKMTSRICLKSVTLVYAPKSLVHRRVARPPPESMTTSIQVGEDDEHITLIQTIHGPTKDENSFKIFQNSKNHFRFFRLDSSVWYFRKQNRLSEFCIGTGIGIGVAFYRPFSSVTDFSRNLPDLDLRIFQN